MAGRGGGFDSTRTAAASRIAIPTALSPIRLRGRPASPSAMNGSCSAHPRKASHTCGQPGPDPYRLAVPSPLSPARIYAR